MKLNYFATICAAVTFTAHALPIPATDSDMEGPATESLPRNPNMPAPIGNKHAVPFSGTSSGDNNGKLSGPDADPNVMEVKPTDTTDDDIIGLERSGWGGLADA